MNIFLYKIYLNEYIFIYIQLGLIQIYKYYFENLNNYKKMFLFIHKYYYKIFINY